RSPSCICERILRHELRRAWVVEPSSQIDQPALTLRVLPGESERRTGRAGLAGYGSIRRERLTARYFARGVSEEPGAAELVVVQVGGHFPGRDLLDGEAVRAIEVAVFAVAQE